ncbi:hypothetical protein FOMG_17760 [Fusarium oxysporum f. sp. melonis 26406]|uniref:C2H2-type domain-containing protein n=2 Tax=Fusarium oxysporum TaxID=5507 RepID=A0A2H3GA09_FUSOX|nr:hypothetical protein FOMG_17760 [Fusarium oxysporum f. sp. melonis 26406]PCD21929.1 hypothetical protein AU210_015732 [Fusarium oxysporum f. sp. radicis-cucumerinum]
MVEKRKYAPGSFPSAHRSTNSLYHEGHLGYQRESNAGVFSDGDESYASCSSTDRSRDSISNGFGHAHKCFQFQSSADQHSDDVKKKLYQVNRPFEKPSSQSLLNASANELISRRPSAEGRFPPALSELPIRYRGILESPTRLTDTPIHSATPPRSTPFYHGDTSPNDSSDVDRSPRIRTKRNNSKGATSTNSYKFVGAETMEMEDGQSLKRLHIDDAYMPGGRKRRAASPDGTFMFSMPSDMRRHCDLRSHGPLQGRYTSLPQGATMSSGSTSRSNSYISNMSMSMHPAGLVTVDSFGRRSPVGPSPGGISPASGSSQYKAPVPLNRDPQASRSRWKSILPQTTSDASTLTIIEVKKPGRTKVLGFFMCECCLKKPKRFETPEELSAHEAEKQYECSFCGNRFKKKNEVERHRNSLHVRRHAWSCSALSGYDMAFHESTRTPGEADACGYCGDEFPRSGRGPGTGVLSGSDARKHATDQDWDERMMHLHEVHKFRECNSSKRFFRADHFRQHLKHSHAGTSKRRTNMLENACMLEEDTTPC